MCRCKDMPPCAESGCDRKSECTAGEAGYCYEHDPIGAW